ncbi:hypothetical protein J2X69_001778 [Algoriphagus sp. 4150]|uniref:hypothetical protein n=1 Tax=Algoriphagus sp. 4150 TaxID=2817756 RepID=UPI00285CDE28|nr:hypothetical protein [Algoriphagus sp. 4150]MDR7129441.1 hypothetical protein [Algoriphagus sp. 4150]
MKLLFLLCFVFINFSCTEKSPEEIYQGKLEELIIGDLVLEKNSLTKEFTNLTVVEDSENEYLVYTRRAGSDKGTAYVFLNLLTAKVEHEVVIPSEGPDAMKGGAYFLPISLNKFVAVNSLGWIATYDSTGSKIAEVKSKLDLPKTLETMVRIEGRKGLMYYKDSYVQIGQDPSHLSSISRNSGPGEMRSSFPLDYKSWLTRINIETGEIENSDFGIPDGYEIFGGDLTATQLLGAYDNKRGVFTLAWPYSEELFVLKELNLQERLIAKSSVAFKFLPSEIVPWGTEWTVWALPKEGSKNIFLLYDPNRDLNIRCSKINESGAGETKFERTKHYVLSIYSGDWELMGDYFFDFETELEVENWFLTSEGLFINKPEQKSEDAYEFYKINLSGFVD